MTKNTRNFDPHVNCKCHRIQWWWKQKNSEICLGYLRFRINFPCDKNPLCVADVCKKTWKKEKKMHPCALVSMQLSGKTDKYSRQNVFHNLWERWTTTFTDGVNTKGPSASGTEWNTPFPWEQVSVQFGLFCTCKSWTRKQWNAARQVLDTGWSGNVDKAATLHLRGPGNCLWHLVATWASMAHSTKKEYALSEMEFRK